MKRVLLLAMSAAAMLAACVPDGPDEWSLDRDRIVAVRAEPPGLLPGDIGHLEVLLAHAGGRTTVEAPRTMSAASSPLFTAVHFNIDHYQIDGPDEAQLASARQELGLPDGVPVPLDVGVSVSGPLYATKRVLLGVAATNPVMPAVTIGGLAPGATIELAAHDDRVDLLIEATTVHWFTSCGELVDDREASATLVTGEACVGELVVVVRDGVTGVAWGVWTLSVR
ncbi:MAG TPA: hypothetical protein VL326_09300 [Kofleriaceae bacterium]|nr:hypothetical protein [Kofleriaceae bacterium]